MKLSSMVHTGEARDGDTVVVMGVVRDRIAHYKTPRSVDFVDDLPRTPTGKLAKNKLQQQVTARASRC